MTAPTAVRGLVVDWGGVLTSDVPTAVRSWAAADDIPVDVYAGVMRDWLGPVYDVAARASPVHALERGETTLADFEQRLADEMSVRTGREIPADGLVLRLLDRFAHAPDMAGLVRRVRATGVRTALLSNSWGAQYPREGWHEMFDVVVLSGDVGMRKPEPRIYRHTLDLLGLDPEECVLVDDLRPNVDAAVALGMVGVLHRSYADTLLELEAVLGVDLA